MSDLDKRVGVLNANQACKNIPAIAIKLINDLHTAYIDMAAEKENQSAWHQRDKAVMAAENEKLLAALIDIARIAGVHPVDKLILKVAREALSEANHE